MSRDSQTDATRMPGKPHNRASFMTPIIFKLPNITNECDVPDGGPLPGEYQAGDPR
jgi:hypothetical protein